MLSPESRRTLLALLLSPAVVPAAAVAFAVYRGLRLVEAIAVAAVYAVFSYAGTLALGLPAHVLLMRWGLSSIWWYAVAGLLLGLLMLAMFFLMNENIAVGRMTVVIFAGFGAITAAVFWKLARARAA